MFSCIRGFIHATLSRYLVFKSRDNYYFPSFHARPILAFRHCSCLRLYIYMFVCVWLSVYLFVCQPRASPHYNQSLVQAGTNILHNNDGRSCCSSDQSNISRQVNEYLLTWYVLTYWGPVTHLCVSDLRSIGSDNGLSPGRRQAIIRTNAGILLIRPLGTNFSEFLVEILIISFKKMRLKVSSGKRRPFCLGLNELNMLH